MSKSTARADALDRMETPEVDGGLAPLGGQHAAVESPLQPAEVQELRENGRAWASAAYEKVLDALDEALLTLPTSNDEAVANTRASLSFHRGTLAFEQDRL